MTRKGWLLFIAISIFWGIPYLFIKIVVRELDPTVVVFARVGIAATNRLYSDWWYTEERSARRERVDKIRRCEPEGTEIPRFDKSHSRRV
jgi:hypothetical protein